MSSEHRHIPEPGELIQPPRPSWAPAIFAFALALTVCGIFAEGFMVRGWIYSIIGGVVALFAFRSMIQDAIRKLLQAPAQATCSRRRPAGRTDLATALSGHPGRGSSLLFRWAVACWRRKVSAEKVQGVPPLPG